MTLNHALHYDAADRQRTFRPSVFGSLSHIVRRAVRLWKNRQAARNLLELEDYLLSDIGVTRGDVEQVLAKGGTVDPTGTLRDLAGTRRRTRMFEEKRKAWTDTGMRTTYLSGPGNNAY